MTGQSHPPSVRLLNTIHQDYSLCELNPAGPIFSHHKTVALDETNGAPITTEQQQLHRARCGHTLNQPAQIVRCQECGEDCCAACAVRCAGFCNRQLCYGCAKRYNEKLYCSKCRLLTIGQRVGSASGRALLRGIHRIFSE